jgi:hypothetical protein
MSRIRAKLTLGPVIDVSAHHSSDLTARLGIEAAFAGCRVHAGPLGDGRAVCWAGQRLARIITVSTGEAGDG